MARQLITSPCLTVAMLLGSGRWAADCQKGLEAYKRGDYATALKEFTPLAEQGGRSAQVVLGEMYRDADGVPQDGKAAVKWFTLAAEDGSHYAQSSLGSMYRDGQGVPQDYVQAHIWAHLSAAQGYKGAVKVRNHVAGKMTPSQIAEAQRLARKRLKKDYKNC